MINFDEVTGENTKSAIKIGHRFLTNPYWMAADQEKQTHYLI